jgi:hypothetical protein
MRKKKTQKEIILFYIKINISLEFFISIGTHQNPWKKIQKDLIKREMHLKWEIRLINPNLDLHFFMIPVVIKYQR